MGGRVYIRILWVQIGLDVDQLELDEMPGASPPRISGEGDPDVPEAELQDRRRAGAGRREQQNEEDCEDPLLAQLEVLRGPQDGVDVHQQVAYCHGAVVPPLVVQVTLCGYLPDGVPHVPSVDKGVDFAQYGPLEDKTEHEPEINQGVIRAEAWLGPPVAAQLLVQMPLDEMDYHTEPELLETGLPVLV